MDYRNRRYFLVGFHYATRNLRMCNLKRVDPTIKFSPPYGHFKQGEYDGEYWTSTGLRFPSFMVGCSIEKAEAVQYELRKTVGEDYYSGYYELNRDNLNQ